MREMKDGWTLERYVEEAGLAAKWRKQGIVQVARTMLKKRLPLEVIAEITGLTIEQLKRLERDDAL
jgi:predicted transposase/invertase (TIGR01784 family)